MNIDFFSAFLLYLFINQLICNYFFFDNYVNLYGLKKTILRFLGYYTVNYYLQHTGDYGTLFV